MADIIQAEEYPVAPVSPKRPHGNTKTGLPFHRLEIGESFRIPPDDYNRVNSARAHYQKKHGNRVKFSSSSIRENGRIVGYLFRRDK